MSEMYYSEGIGKKPQLEITPRLRRLRELGKMTR
jgi:hypothetical protein